MKLIENSSQENATIRDEIVEVATNDHSSPVLDQNTVDISSTILLDVTPAINNAKPSNKRPSKTQKDTDKTLSKVHKKYQTRYYCSRHKRFHFHEHSASTRHTRTKQENSDSGLSPEQTRSANTHRIRMRQEHIKSKRKSARKVFDILAKSTSESYDELKVNKDISSQSSDAPSDLSKISINIDLGTVKRQAIELIKSEKKPSAPNAPIPSEAPTPRETASILRKPPNKHSTLLAEPQTLIQKVKRSLKPVRPAVVLTPPRAR